MTATDEEALREVGALIDELTFMRKTHVGWAEHFEREPEVEARYVATGEWDDAKEHRRCIDVYDRAIAAINSIPDQIASAVAAEREACAKCADYYYASYDPSTVADTIRARGDTQ
jgi:hypothetical protein